MAQVQHGKACKLCQKLARAHAKGHAAFLALGEGWTPTTRKGSDARDINRVNRKALKAHVGMEKGTVLQAYKVAEYLPKYAPRGNRA